MCDSENKLAYAFKDKYLESHKEYGHWLTDFRPGVDLASIPWHEEGAHPIWIFGENEEPFIIYFVDGSSLVVNDPEIAALDSPDHIGRYVSQIMSCYDLRLNLSDE